jgi:hypothetical protein
MVSRHPGSVAQVSSDAVALLITSDRRLVRDLTAMLRQLDMPLQVQHVSATPADVKAPPALLFVDAEACPRDLHAARQRFPDVCCVAIVGLWSETEAEVQGYVDHTLHKPLRLPELVDLCRRLQPAHRRLSA